MPKLSFNFISIFSFLITIFLSTTAYANTNKLPVNLFAEEATLEQPMLSVDGSRLAYLYRTQGKEIIVVQNIDTQQKIGVPLVGDAEVRWFRWANHDVLLVSYLYESIDNAFRRTLYQTRLGSFDTSTQKFRWLEDKVRNSANSRLKTKSVYRSLRNDYIVDFLPDDPDHVLQAINKDLEGKLVIRKLNVRTAVGKTIQEGRRGYYNYVFDKNKDMRVAYGYDYQEQVWKHSYKSARDGRWRRLREEHWGFDLDVFRVLAFTKDPEVAYVRDLSQHGTTGIFLMNLETNEKVKEIFVHPEFDARFIRFTGPSGKSGLATQGKLSSVAYIDDTYKEHFISKYSAKLQTIVDKSLPGMLNTIISQARKAKRFVILSHSATDDGVYYLFDLVKGSLEPIGEVKPGLNPKYLGEVERVNIPVQDGSTIPAYITYPQGVKRKNLPTVVLPHGGPHARDYMYFDYLAQFIANRGYLVIQPNFRGSSGYGQAYLNEGIMQWGGLMQQDVDDTTNWLIKEGLANPNRMCLAGWSYGGYSALVGAYQTPEKYKCFISINGVANLPEMKSGDKYKFAFGRDFIKKVGREGHSDQSVSPYHQAEKIKRPVLLVATKDDRRVPYAQSTMMHDKLKGRGLSELLLMDEGDHGIWDVPNKTRLLNKLETFLQKHIGDQTISQIIIGPCIISGAYGIRSNVSPQKNNASSQII